MMIFVYEIRYIDKLRLIPVTECPKTRTIATAFNNVNERNVMRLYRRLIRNGNMPKLDNLKDGNFRITYLALSDGLKYDPYYKGGTWYVEEGVFKHDYTR